MYKNNVIEDDSKEVAGQAYSKFLDVLEHAEGSERLYVHSDVAVMAFRAGKLDKAEAHALELFELADEWENSWQTTVSNALDKIFGDPSSDLGYGSGSLENRTRYIANIVLAKVAYEKGNKNEATKYLATANLVPGRYTTLLDTTDILLGK